jgi:pheromone shutdown protein TraB
LGFWLLGTRRMLSRYAAVEDLPSLAESHLRERYGALTELLVDRRDELLVAAVARIHQERSGEPIEVAVVYGAGHMPAVARYLLAGYGYRPREAAWLTVFDL